MIRFVKNQDYEGWKKLYLQYGEFYQVPMTHEGLSRVWNWLNDSSHEMEGLVYEKTGKIVGLAHFRRMPNPLRACDIGFLDDLFIDPAERGQRLGEALIEELVKIAKSKGCQKSAGLQRMTIIGQEPCMIVLPRKRCGILTKF